jgi:hypothetical protein
VGQNLNINPRPPGQWIEIGGPRRGQPTPEFYRFVVNLLNLAGANADLTIEELNDYVLTQPSPFIAMQALFRRIGDLETYLWTLRLGAIQTAQAAAAGYVSAVLTTAESLAAGALVNVNASFQAQNANGTVQGKDAHGFVLQAYGSSVPATVYFSGVNNMVSGLTGGYAYLGLSAGAVTSTAPSASGQVVQRVGEAIAATKFVFQPQVSTWL